MKVITQRLKIKTQADGGMHDITDQVESKLQESTLTNGSLTLFCVGSTCAISTVEYEPGLLKDFPAALERIAPRDIDYAHHQTWHDDNGRSHIKATLMGPSLTVPFEEKQLTLGTWQQIVFFDFDVRARERELFVHIIGE